MVGDTPLDIQAAHAVDCTAVRRGDRALRRGGAREAGADHVLETLRKQLQLMTFGTAGA